MTQQNAIKQVGAELLQQFLGLLQRRVLSPPYNLSEEDADRLVKSMNDASVSLYEESSDMLIDVASEGHLQLCSTLLAAYRALLGLQPESSDVMVDIDEALVQPLRERIDWWLDVRFGVHGDKPEQTFDVMAAKFAMTGTARFGESFEYIQEKLDQTQSLVQVRRCFFNDFFRRHGAENVTSLICKMDLVWADRINNSGHNVRFERPSLLSAGDNCCRFYFYRDDAALK